MPRHATYRPRPLSPHEILSAALTRRKASCPVVATAGTLEIVTPASITAHLTVVAIRRHLRVRIGVAVPSATGVGASQLHTRRYFLAVESLLQPKLQRIRGVRGRSARNPSDVFAHKFNRFRVFEVRDEKFTFHLQDLVLTEKHVSVEFSLEIEALTQR